MLGYCLGRTSLGGTQPWEILHRQMSVKADGIGWGVSPPRGDRKEDRGLGKGPERSQDKVRAPKGGGH